MIYFAQDEVTFFIKIGFTEGDPEGRVRALQTGNPSPIVLLFAMPGAQADEAAIHQRLAAHRGRGEWFRPSREVLAFLAEHWRKAVDQPIRHMEMHFLAGHYKLSAPETKFAWWLIQLLIQHGPLAFSRQGPKGDSIDHMVKGRAWEVFRDGGAGSLEKVFTTVEDYADSVMRFQEVELEAVGHSLDHRFDGVGAWRA